MAKKKSVYEESDLNLTPMIDCVFLLLIFFMVTTVFKQPYSLKLELPKARQAQQVEDKKLVGSITSDGRMEINRQLIQAGNLEQVLLQEKQNTGSLTLVLRTDKDTKHKHMLEVLEVAKRAGVEKIVLATEDQKIDL